MKSFINIKKPCNEPWDEMTDLPDGKFCASCSKKVLDLSILSDFEINKIISQHKDQKFCGRVYHHQLLRPIHSEQFSTILEISNKKSFSKIAAGIMITASLSGNLSAQSTPSVPIELSKIKVNKNKENKTKENEKTPENLFTIKGKVINRNTGKPMSGAIVKLITVLEVFITKTDVKGNYIIEVPQNFVRDKNLLYFTSPNSEYPATELLMVAREELSTKTLITKIDEESPFARVYGEIAPHLASKKSLVLVDGKKLDSQTFNRSRMIYGEQFDFYYIPKEFAPAVTKNKEVEDVFIVFFKK